VQLIRCGDAATTTLELQRQPTPNYGDVHGFVFDLESGLPIVGTPVQDQFTDATGAYTLHHIFVGMGAVTVAPNPTYIIAGDYTYYGYNEVPSTNAYYSQALVHVTVRANETVAAPDIHLLKRRFGTVHGTVRDIASHETLGNSGWVIGGNFDGGRTADDGTYQSRPVGVPFPGNVPLPITVSANPGDGSYWPGQTSGNILANQNTTVDINLIRVCGGATIIGSVINAVTLAPIANATVAVVSALTGNTIAYDFSDAAGRFALHDIRVGTDNSPIEVDVYANATGFFGQHKRVTIFCNATIGVDFGQPSTQTGTIQGHVTNLDSTQPMAGVFIGSEFGATATTDSSGYYTLTGAPLGANNADRTWSITASPGGFVPLSLPATVSATATVTLDFGFHLVTPTPLPTRTPTLTPTPTLTSTPDATLSPTATPTVTASPTETATPTPSPTATVTASPTPTLTLTATPTLSPTATVTASPTPTPTLTATPTLTSTPTPPVPGSLHSLALDGRSGAAEAPASAAINLTADWTLELWFRDDDPNGFDHDYRYLVNKGDGLAPEAPFYLLLGKGNLLAGARSGGVNQPLTYNLHMAGYAAKIWQHAAVTYQASSHRLTLYLDGTWVADQVVPRASSGNSLPLEIGRQGALMAKNWLGKIDDLRLWNVARSATDIAASYRAELSGVQAGLVASWKFDEPDGTIAAEATAGDAAILSGGATFSPDVHP